MKLFLLTTAAIALSAVPSLAQEAPAGEEEYEDHLGLGVPWIRVNGAMAVEVWGDDNILLSRRDAVSDTITVLAPELHARAGEDDGYLKIDYRGRDRIFMKNSEFSGVENYVDAAMHLRSGQFRIDAWDSYQNRNDPFSLPGETKRIDWLQNEGGGTLAADLGGIEIEAAGEARRFEIFDRTFDRFDHRRVLTSLLAAMDFMGKAQALAEGGWAHTTYDNEDLLDDFDLFWYAGGLRGSLAENLQLTVKLGGFHVDPKMFSGTIESASGTGFYFSAAATWQPVQDGNLWVGIQRRPVESIYTGWMVVERYEALYTYQIWGRVTFTMGGYYEDDRESKGGENRKAWGLNGGASYAVSRHFSLSGGVEGRWKSSEFDTFDYRNVRAFLGASVAW